MCDICKPKKITREEEKKLLEKIEKMIERGEFNETEETLSNDDYSRIGSNAGISLAMTYSGNDAWYYIGSLNFQPWDATKVKELYLRAEKKLQEMLIGREMNKSMGILSDIIKK